MTGHAICSSWPTPSSTGKRIELADVSKCFDGRVILSPSDLTVEQNDFIAITGPNGGGKTTLLRIMLGMLKPDTGEVRYFENGMSVKRLKIGYMPQKSSIDPKFPMTVSDTVSSGLLTSPFTHGGFSKDEKTERLHNALEAFGLEGMADAPLATLSGGQVQRSLLARTVVSTPSIIILDEPLSYLDREQCNNLCNLLDNIKGKTAIIVVSHQMEVFSDIANRKIYVDKTIKQWF